MTRNQVALLIFITSVILGALGFGYSQRPIIDYYIYCSTDIGESLDFNYDILLVVLCVRNRGLSDARLDLVLKLENAVFTNGENTSFTLYSEANDEVRVSWRARKETEEYGDLSLFVVPIESADFFNVTYTVEKKGPGNIVGDYVNNFIEIIGYNPVILAFEKIDGSEYVRID